MNEQLRNEEIHIVGAVDNNYAQHLGVTFTSTLMNIPTGTFAHLYVISTGITEENQNKLEKTVSRFNARIQFIRVDSAPYEVFHTSGHITKAAYLRLAIPDILPLSVQKVIYLDSDVVVTGNIVELWETDLKGHAIAAVPDFLMYSRCKDLQIPEGAYFNSGIMIMNLSKWRKESLTRKAMDYIARSTITLACHDQDVLNALLFDDWLELPLTWNVNTFIVKEWKVSNPPAIIHYTDVSKPWHLDNFHPFKKEYYKYKRMTEWKSSMPEVNLNRIMIRMAKKVLPKSIKKAVKKAATKVMSN
ncbi:glycosyltransferase family 8 protein [Cohnella suwonensis]|uniref:Glycosyltransferase family 8 protein n=1 Tax=Cohnella suwonensis TaxID=696072 RepID=A0ABW0M560_9BACL